MRSKFRSLTDEEVATLRALLHERSRVPPDQRQFFEHHDAAEETLSGALYWSIGVLWQDKPALLLAGSAAIIAQLVLLAWKMVG